VRKRERKEGEARREERRGNTGPGEQMMDGKEMTVGALAVGILSLIGSTVLIVLVVALRFLSIGTALPRAKIKHANSQLMANGVSKIHASTMSASATLFTSFLTVFVFPCIMGHAVLRCCVRERNAPHDCRRHGTHRLKYSGPACSQRQQSAGSNRPVQNYSQPSDDRLP